MQAAPEGALSNQSLPAFLDWTAETYGWRPALLYKPALKTEVTTYAELREWADHVAYRLIDRGIRPGDRVVLWGSNSPDWVAAFFGILKAGAIVVPLDVRSSPEFVARVLEQSEPSLAIVSSSLAGGWSHSTPACSIEELTDSSQTAHLISLPEVSAGDLAEIIFTSGTTGTPKGVMLSHRNIRSNVEASNEIMPSGPRYRPLSILPLSHLLEQTCGLMLALRGGTSIAYATAIQPAAILRDMQEYRVTTMVLVPRVLSLFMSSIERGVQKQGKQRMWDVLMRVSARLPRRVRRILFRSVIRSFGGRIDFFVVGGAPLDPLLERKWELMGIPILQGYGSTETSPIITASSVEKRTPRSVGRAVPGVRIRVAGDGEILIQGPNVMLGYWRNPEATASAIEDGWYHTGDLGQVDSAGRLFLKGRKKNMIVLANGLNVYPEDVEDALAAVPGVIEAVVVPVPSSFGPEVHAVLLCEKDAPPAETIVGQANERLAPHQRIRSWSTWPYPDFPRTHTAKIKRQDVMDFATSARNTVGREAPAETSGDSTVRGGSGPQLRKAVAAIGQISEADLAPETTMAEIGLSGARLLRLGRAVEDRIGKHLDASKVGPETTLAELETLLLAENPAGEHPYPLWPFSHRIRSVRTALQWPVLAAIELVAKPQVLGAAELEGVGPAVYVVSYDSLLDAPFVLASLPGPIRSRIGLSASWKNNRRSSTVQMLVALIFNSFRYSEAGSPHATLAHAAGLLNHGWSVLFLLRGSKGEVPGDIALLAQEFHAPVVPISISGLPSKKLVPRAGEVTVRFGRLLPVSQDHENHQPPHIETTDPGALTRDASLAGAASGPGARSGSSRQ
jgi:long-chain acyl-CoA synthetase